MGHGVRPGAILQELGNPCHDHVQRDVTSEDHVHPRLGGGQGGGAVSARRSRNGVSRVVGCLRTRVNSS